VHFYKPHTQILARKPKYDRKSVVPLPKMHKYRVIKGPLTSEAAMKKIEDNNTLVFLVDKRANKRQIKEAVKSIYEIQTLKVNTLIRCVGWQWLWVIGPLVWRAVAWALPWPAIAAAAAAVGHFAVTRRAGVLYGCPCSSRVARVLGVGCWLWCHGSVGPVSEGLLLWLLCLCVRVQPRRPEEGIRAPDR
jgi:hypothetical protein